MTETVNPKDKIPPARQKAEYYRCGCCNGTGRIKLTGARKRALDLLRENPGMTAAELCLLDSCTSEAMSNRLAWLAVYGFATFERNGRYKHYRALEGG